MRVLLVEDNEEDALLIQEALADTRIEIQRAERLSSALEQLGKGGVDVVLLDVSLPDSHGLENIEILQRCAPAVPIVLMTGHNDEEAGLRAVEKGAQDYLIKGQTDGCLLARSLRYAIQRHKAEETLKERNRELLVFRNISETILRSLDLNWIVEKILEQAMLNSSFDIGNIRLLDPGGETLKMVATRGYRDPENAAKHRTVVRVPNIATSSIGDRLFNQPCVQDDVQNQGGSRTFKREGVETFVIVPVRADGEMLGMLQLGSRTPRKFRQSELQLLKAIGSQVGIAIQRARLYEEISNQACALQIASTMQADFTAMIAHDLRSPLLNISGAAEVMLDGVFGSITEDQRKWLGRIVENSRSLVALVTDFLDVSKIEAGYISLNKEPLNLAELINDVLENYRIVAEKKRISLRQCITPCKVVQADPRRLAQVVGNLISNAIKFTAEEGEIEVGLRANAVNVELWVKDNGIGIPFAEIPNLFEKYRQCSNINESGHKGTGLGLLICKMVVQAHGGKIEVRSKEGAGSTFCLSLPMDVCPQEVLTAA